MSTEIPHNARAWHARTLLALSAWLLACGARTPLLADDPGRPTDQADASDVRDASPGERRFPRQISPISLGDVSTLRPTLRWQLPDGFDGAQVELCRDRACARVIETLGVLGTSVRPAAALPARSAVFWRLRATRGATTDATLSPTWLFHVPARDNANAIDTSTHPHLDLNGDGLDEVVVGACFASPSGRYQAGVAQVFYGSAAGLSRVAAQVLEGAAPGDQLGIAVASAGDVNGDGFGDLVLGGHRADREGREDAGIAQVYHGSARGLGGSPAVVMVGQGAGELFGLSVTSAGDLDRDGYGDIVVGAPFADPMGRTDAGSARVFYGSAAGVAASPAWALEGLAGGDQLGFAVAGAGDLNGDGYNDVIVGAHGADALGLNDSGRVHVILGSPTGLGTLPSHSLEGPVAQRHFGYNLASAGDLNGDGYSDLVVSDTAGYLLTQSPSLVRVFYGGSEGPGPQAARVLVAHPSAHALGTSLASARDVNGDGYGDLVVGAPEAIPNERSLAGRVSVFVGSPSGIAEAPTQVLRGVAMGDVFGRSVSGAGDLNGDGYCDLVVGANGEAPRGLVRAGVVRVYLGQNTGVSEVPVDVLEGSEAEGQFGVSVAHHWTRDRASRRCAAYAHSVDTLHR
ncbi:MAG: FG-GAP-like repeat-containing protein [Deltaproteobacteria bacterium]|nr:FG-GAP-like repeat-containing protein [Deltaproteobacteria bacterium]